MMYLKILLGILIVSATAFACMIASATTIDEDYDD